MNAWQIKVATALALVAVGLSAWYMYRKKEMYVVGVTRVVHVLPCCADESVQALRKQYPLAELNVWTTERLVGFTQHSYPLIWEALEKHPSTPRTDLWRVLLGAHFGGLILSENVRLRDSDLDRYFASQGKEILLFTESEWTDPLDARMRDEPIRRGIPEEVVRLSFRVFSASAPHHPFLRKVLDRQMYHLDTLTIQSEYDSGYATGKVCWSTCYAEFGRTDPTVERVSLDEANTMVY
jgi:hypothetical protein